MAIRIPRRLAEVCRETEERSNWLGHLPEVIMSLRERLSLAIADPFETAEGSCAWVAPVALPDQTPAVLKIGMPHMEAEHEIAGLRFWNGDPTVHLLNADDDLGAMLLERCEPGTTLRELPETEQDVVVAGLLRRLWRSPLPHVFRPLSAMTERWGTEAIAQREHWPDGGVTAEGLRLFKELSKGAPNDVLLATDLHAGNILRAQRAPWLVIDPKPFIGDAAYDATQHLFNCYSRLRDQPEFTIRRFAELLEVDDERVWLWTFARSAVAAGSNWQNPKWLELAQALQRRPI